jgi:hypothetical protein
VEFGFVSSVHVQYHSPLLEEELIGVRAMNLGVAQRAGLILLSLIVERWSCWRTLVGRKRMAFQAKQVDLGALQ